MTHTESADANEKRGKHVAVSGAVEVVFVDGADVPIKHKHADRMIVMRNSDDPDGDAGEDLQRNCDC
jgi:hypothetical protein